MTEHNKERSNMTKTWFITGAARGLGAEVARSALANGDNVVATARDIESARKSLGQQTDRLLLLPLDVTAPDAVTSAVTAAVDRFAAIDVLVNNAGYGQLGIFEESSEEDVRRQFETNVFGLMAVTKAVLPIMRDRRSGHIINIASIGGVLAFDLCTLYGTSKFAVEGFSVNLARDVARLGIHVTVVEPGFFRTDFLDPSSARFPGHRIDDYSEIREKTQAAYRAYNHRQPGDPSKFGPALLNLVNAENPPVHLLLGSDALSLARKELVDRSAEIDAWASLSASTDHDDVA
jgi:NAD(P)-dependent dehydrogenase (short-subunit alcohol dehydrogenase family)